MLISHLSPLQRPRRCLYSRDVYHTIITKLERNQIPTYKGILNSFRVRAGQKQTQIQTKQGKVGKSHRMSTQQCLMQCLQRIFTEMPPHYEDAYVYEKFKAKQNACTALRTNSTPVSLSEYIHPGDHRVNTLIMLVFFPYSIFLFK